MEITKAIDIAEKHALEFSKKNTVKDTIKIGVTGQKAVVIDTPEKEAKSQYVFNVDIKEGRAFAIAEKQQKEKNKSLSIYFDTKNLQYLNELSKKSGKNRSTIINELIEELRFKK